MTLRLKVKCPVCGWKGEVEAEKVKGNIAPTCPLCYMDLIVDSAERREK